MTYICTSITPLICFCYERMNVQPKGGILNHEEIEHDSSMNYT